MVTLNNVIESDLIVYVVVVIFFFKLDMERYIMYLITGSKGNGEFCFHLNLCISWEKVNRKIKIQGRMKQTVSQGTSNVFCYVAQVKYEVIWQEVKWTYGWEEIG